MDNELLNQLAARGCEIEQALADTYMGVEAMMVKFIRKVPATDVVKRLGEAMSTGDPRTVFEVAHELKGLYGTTALTPLFAKCCEIVEPARAGSIDGLDAKFEELRTMHADFCSLIGSCS